MSTLLFVFMSILGGCLFGLQASINGAFGKRIGIYESSLISCIIATLVLSVVVLVFGKENLLHLPVFPKWQLLGGVLGAFIVMSMVITVPKIGAASAVFGAMFGQIIVSTLIDNFGFFDVPVIKIDIFRIAGIIFMLIGLLLIFKGNLSQSSGISYS